MPIVIIPSPLRAHTNNQREVVIDGDSLKETMDYLLQLFPKLRTIHQDSALLSIFVNSKIVKTHVDEWANLALKSDDEVALIVPIAGG